MNLYNFHSDPESLALHKKAHQLVPKLMVGHSGNFPENLSPTQIRAISKDPFFAFVYAYNVLGKQRWPEAEPYIMKDPRSACQYCKYIIDGRWPEAEPYIMKDPQSALYYASSILHKRWPEAEPFIKKHDFYWKQYKNEFSI